MVTFHVLIATIGRASLQNMISSLNELCEDDHLTIVYDGVPKSNVDFSMIKAHIHIYQEAEKLGYWGHPIRNKYSPSLEKTDFVLHADDDDVYVKDGITLLRNQATNLNVLYFCKMKNYDGTILPRKNVVQIGEIGTPMGIIPFHARHLASWENEMGGDGLFYMRLSKTFQNNIKFLDILLYNVRNN